MLIVEKFWICKNSILCGGGGIIRILEIPKWGMAENQLGTAGLD